MEKVSEMMIEVSGGLLTEVDNFEEMQAHTELIKHAWNMSLYSKNKRKAKLKQFIKSQEPYAPNREALLGLEWEYKRIMKRKDSLYPSVRQKIIIAEAIEKGKDDYLLRAYFMDAGS